MFTNVKIQNRVDTSTKWESANPTLLSGEVGIENSSAGYRMKVGDGLTAWNDLPYTNGSYNNVKVDFTFASGATSATYTNAAITANHALSQVVYATGKANMTGNITWETSAGTLTLSFPATTGEVTGSFILVYAA